MNKLTYNISMGVATALITAGAYVLCGVGGALVVCGLTVLVNTILAMKVAD